MICKKCGYENKDSSSFCAECGAPLVREDEEKVPEAPAVPEAPVTPEATAAPEAPAVPVYAAPAAPEAQPYAAPYAAPAYQQPYAATAYAPPPAQPVKEKKQGKGGKIALIVTTVILALALIGGGIFGYLLYQQKTDEINTLAEEKTALEDQLKEATDKSGTLADDYDALSGKYDTLSADYDALSGQYDELNKSYEELREYADGLYEEYSGIYEEYDFFHKYAVMCSDQNTYYHTYECEDWDRSAFWIYNIDAAKSKEFTPCPKCMAETEEAAP
ncbi:MAG: zinc-ribbon domain-containing protein [Oscillospiraceae bacterium]|nr:zinc-ribbon domain-containing protein [Oscillospiraceae bacterium]